MPHALKVFHPAAPAELVAAICTAGPAVCSQQA